MVLGVPAMEITTAEHIDPQGVIKHWKPKAGDVKKAESGL